MASSGGEGGGLEQGGQRGGAEALQQNRPLEASARAGRHYPGIKGHLSLLQGSLYVPVADSKLCNSKKAAKSRYGAGHGKVGLCVNGRMYHSPLPRTPK